MEKETKCPCCPNHCDINALSCGKGRSYFENGVEKTENRKSHHTEKDEALMSLEEKIINKMHQCGHYLHHSQDVKNIDFLTEEEKNTLYQTLSKCLDNWK